MAVREFGTVRKLPSGRWQVRYWAPDGVRRAAPETFERKGDATRWLAELLSAGVSVSVAAKAYRLLRAVLHTAVDDEVIRRNPCRIKGADQEHAVERPTLALAQVAALARRMPPRLVALVRLGTYASLRWGELAALRRSDLVWI